MNQGVEVLASPATTTLPVKIEGVVLAWYVVTK